jgi:hypothetical protein
MLAFISPPEDFADISPGQRKFCDDFRHAIEGELFETREAAELHLRALFEANGRSVCEPVRQNVYYGARLAYLEGEWIEGALMATLRRFKSIKIDEDMIATARHLLNLCGKERVNLRAEVLEIPPPMVTDFDVVEWKAEKFCKPIEEYRIAPQWIHFSLSEDTCERVQAFRQEFGAMNLDAGGYFYSAMDFMNRRELLYRIELRDRP